MHLTVNLRSFKKLVRHNKKRMKLFLSKLEKNPPRGLDQMVVQADRLAWAHTDCLHCANCCKTMSPTYTRSDVQRISKFLGMTQSAFRKKWLYKDKSGDWLNVNQPCQFLDLETNMCRIYEVRPRDCAGFPHHTKKKMVDYMHVYKQNLEYCPATHRLVKNLMDRLSKA
ncbi:MAG: zinc/iron-chelating domain-containing protein [Bacteroidetes bacterium]|nr:MAG: zinc/iron-chelating domain-containing protein [Bacteroidota bacterium]